MLSFTTMGVPLLLTTGTTTSTRRATVPHTSVEDGGMKSEFYFMPKSSRQICFCFAKHATESSSPPKFTIYAGAFFCAHLGYIGQVIGLGSSWTVALFFSCVKSTEIWVDLFNFFNLIFIIWTPSFFFTVKIINHISWLKIMKLSTLAYTIIAVYWVYPRGHEWPLSFLNWLIFVDILLSWDILCQLLRRSPERRIPRAAWPQERLLHHLVGPRGQRQSPTCPH